ncbi:MAG: hypothetical protein LAO09_15175 [Acidobacteriia bacterium]|nr:hypothetical protein [Terriglobia bacterium]
MLSKVEYDDLVIRLKQALVAGFVFMVFAATVGVDAGAQIHGAPPSVTSMGFGGHAISGVSPSVTSLGPRGYTPGFNPAFPSSRPWFGVPTSHPVGGRPHHRPHRPFGSTVYAVPYFVYTDNYDTQGYAENYPSEEQYNGGPTIFDRRGSGATQRQAEEAPVEREPEPAASATTQPQPEIAADQPATVLIFKDGHQLEIGNYAIVGATLYDLTEGHRRKIALADLDLTATVNQNDDRGIDFQVPASSRVN